MINVIKYGNIPIKKVYVGTDVLFESEALNNTIVIDQRYLNDNNVHITGDTFCDGTTTPKQGLNSGNNFFAWAKVNTHSYVGTFNTEDNVLSLKQLADNTRLLYADGTDASSDITDITKCVITIVPEFWYKPVETETDIWEINFKNYNPEDNTYIHYPANICIGTYKACIINNGEIINPSTTRSYTLGDKLTSISGITPSVYYSQVSFKSASRATGNRFRLITIKVHSAVALLFYGYYGNVNAQELCGTGVNTYPRTTGQCDNLGIESSPASGTNNTNFLGLEDWWGNIYEWIDDFYTTGSGNAKIVDYDGSTIIETVTGGTTAACIKTIDFSKGIIIPKIQDGSDYGKYYTDYGVVYDSAGLVAYRSGYAANALGGVAFLSTARGASTAHADIGSRLLYDGEVNFID